MASANLDLVRSIYETWGRTAIKTVRMLRALDGVVGSLCDERLGLTRSSEAVG
jgi:hypothetical protein